MKTLEEIDKLVGCYAMLTEPEKKELRDAILENPESRQRVINGFIQQGDYGRAWALSLSYCA